MLGSGADGLEFQCRFDFGCQIWILRWPSLIYRAVVDSVLEKKLDYWRPMRWFNKSKSLTSMVDPMTDLMVQGCINE